MTALKKPRISWSSKKNEKQLQDQMDQIIAWSKNLRELDILYYQGKYRELVLEVERNFAGLEIPPTIKEEITALSNEAKPRSILQFYETARSIYSSNSKKGILMYIDRLLMNTEWQLV